MLEGGPANSYKSLNLRLVIIASFSNLSMIRDNFLIILWSAAEANGMVGEEFFQNRIKKLLINLKL